MDTSKKEDAVEEVMMDPSNNKINNSLGAPDAPDALGLVGIDQDMEAKVA